MDFTDYIFLDSDGADEVPVDTFGGLVAFDCYQCGHPVICSSAENERGYDEEHPSACKGCGTPYYLEVRYHNQKMYIHSLWRDPDDPNAF